MGQPMLICGDCLEAMAELADQSLHAVCTDPPYGFVEFAPDQIAKLRAGRGGVWRIPPNWDGCERKPLPRFSILTEEQKKEIEAFMGRWASVLKPKLRPGAHVLIAGNPALQMYVQNAMVGAGFENRAAILRVYHGFRGGDRPKNAEREFPQVCVTPRGNYEPWMLFRNPISERTVADNLRRWETGGLRMLAGGKPLPDVVASFKTPASERRIADHPSLKPQHLLRIFIRALLPLGRGLVLDPFMGSGSTVAAAVSLGVDAIGIEIDPHFFAIAQKAIPQLAALHPQMSGDDITFVPENGTKREHEEPLLFLR